MVSGVLRSFNSLQISLNVQIRCGFGRSPANLDIARLLFQPSCPARIWAWLVKRRIGPKTMSGFYCRFPLKKGYHLHKTHTSLCVSMCVCVRMNVCVCVSVNV